MFAAGLQDIERTLNIDFVRLNWFSDRVGYTGDGRQMHYPVSVLHTPLYVFSVSNVAIKET